jgi:hypothetical protein
MKRLFIFTCEENVLIRPDVKFRYPKLLMQLVFKDFKRMSCY